MNDVRSTLTDLERDSADGNAPVVLRGAHVIDPSQGLDGVMDVAIEGGRITAVGPDVRAPDNATAVSLAGAYLSPGWIDIHTHVLHGFASVGIDPDRCGIRAGVTLVADAGSAGTSNFGALEVIARRSATKVRAFANLSRIGLVGLGRTREESVGELETIQLADPGGVADLIRSNPLALGIKLRLGREIVGDSGRVALWMALHAARESKSRLMVHVGGLGPDITDVAGQLTRADILTHVFTPNPGGTGGNPAILRELFALSKDRGFTIDVGHGRKSMSFEIARAALSLGLFPNTISSDAAGYSVDGPVYDLPTTMTKFLALGMPMGRVIRAVTERAADALGIAAHGTLAVGSPADITVFNVPTGRREFRDAIGEELTADAWFAPLGCLVDGRPYASQSVAELARN